MWPFPRTQSLRKRLSQPAWTCEQLENRMLLSVSTQAAMSPQARLLAAAARPETQFLTASNREVRSVCADLLRQVASATKANEAEIKLSQQLGDPASVAVNQQDKAELASIGSQIRSEQREIQAEVNAIIKQIDQIVKEGQRDIKQDPVNADQHLAEGIDAIAQARSNADDVLNDALVLKDEAEARITEVRGRAGAEGSLGVFTGNPTAVFFALDGVEGNTFGDLTLFLGRDGDRLIGRQVPKANDRWSVATYNEARQYLRQREGRVTDVLLDCVMTGDSVVSGTLSYQLRVLGRSGPQSYQLVYGSFSEGGRVFSAQLLNPQNVIVGQLTLSRS